MFTPFRSTQLVCNYHCANIYAKELNEKKTQKEWKERKAKLKSELMTLSDWLKIAQKHFNHYIRLRDKGNNCISCDKEFNKNEIVHASHYKPAGNCYNVRFNEDNVWISCVKCNTHLSGNGTEYRKRLVDKIGIERVEEIERLSTITRKFTIDEVKKIAETYKEKVRNIRKSLEK
jgi:hypothetical protein